MYRNMKLLSELLLKIRLEASKILWVLALTFSCLQISGNLECKSCLLSKQAASA